MRMPMNLISYYTIQFLSSINLFSKLWVIKEILKVKNLVQDIKSLLKF